MRSLIVAAYLLAASVNGSSSSLAQARPSRESLDIGTIERIVDATRRLCLSGTQYTLNVNSDGSVVLRNRSPGFEGGLRITQNQGQGGALNYENEGIRLQADANIIGCIGQNLPRLLDAAAVRLPETNRDELVTCWERGSAEVARQWRVTGPYEGNAVIDEELMPVAFLRDATKKEVPSLADLYARNLVRNPTWSSAPRLTLGREQYHPPDQRGPGVTIVDSARNRYRLSLTVVSQRGQVPWVEPFVSGIISFERQTQVPSSQRHRCVDQ